MHLRSWRPGFSTANIFTARVGFSEMRRDSLAERRFLAELERRARGLPGVRSVALASGLPSVGSGTTRIALAGVGYAREDDYPRAGWMAVSPGFFETTGLPVLRGRGLTAEDRAGGVRVAVLLTGTIQTVLVAVHPRDPIVFGGVAGVLAVAGLLACHVRARRATRVDPMVAVRTESRRVRQRETRKERPREAGASRGRSFRVSQLAVRSVSHRTQTSPALDTARPGCRHRTPQAVDILQPRAPAAHDAERRDAQLKLNSS